MIEINEYTVSVRVEGYGISMNVKVPAKDPDDAFNLACSQEFRYQDDDPYMLLVITEEEEPSVLCTYETLQEATQHCDSITDGNWMLVQRDFDDDGEGTVIRSSDEEYDL